MCRWHACVHAANARAGCACACMHAAGARDGCGWRQGADPRVCSRARAGAAAAAGRVLGGAPADGARRAAVCVGVRCGRAPASCVCAGVAARPALCTRPPQAPIFLAGGLAARANSLYRLLLNWAGQRLRSGPPGTRPGAFRFARVAPWAPELLHQPVRGQQPDVLATCCAVLCCAGVPRRLCCRC